MILLQQEIRGLKVNNEVFEGMMANNEKIVKECRELMDEAERGSALKDKKVTQRNMENDYLRSLMNDDNNLETFDNDKNCFTTDLMECVMNLSNCNVASNKMCHVIRYVCELCRKKPTRLPSEWTINRINLSKSTVALKHLQEVTGKHNLTLYSDETSKFGKNFEVYAITDEEQNSYLLGLREMANKSSQSVLDTLKDILIDINNNLPSTDAGYNILAHIKNTMSDRATTEKKFHELLECYRIEILPKVTDSWSQMDEMEKEACSSINIFFCGLHLLVGCADVCATSIGDFEKMQSVETASSATGSVSKWKKGESGTARLIRCCSKAFARGADEKSGVHGSWKTYIEEKSSKVLFQPFKHNRFNIIFMLGGIVYFHRTAVLDFLENVNGVTNMLLEQIVSDIKCDTFIAGCRAFGLLSKLITSPLWRLIEGKTHILRMNSEYLELCKFLECMSTSERVVEEFLTGRNTPFESQDADDPVYRELIKKCSLDELTCQILMLLSRGILTLFERQLKDQLPGGKYEHFSNQVLSQTESVMKHNKLPEFFFCQLDFLLHYRQNASLLCNESFLMFSHNKTGDWLKEMEEGEKKHILQESRMQGRNMTKLFKERLEEIRKRRQEALNEKETQIKMKRCKVLKTKEDATNNILYFGLWQSDGDVDHKLVEITSVTEKRKALQSQLNFRKKVLLQKSHIAGVFSFSSKISGKSKLLSISDLTTNLKKLIAEAFKRPEQHEPDLPGTPLLVGKRVEHTFADSAKYIGSILSVVPGYPSWYNIKYDNYDDIYVYDLIKDYGDGDLIIKIDDI